MSKPSGKTETTLILRRIYDAPPDRVFRAWTDRSELKSWFAADLKHVIHSVAIDLRVGGVFRSAFGMPGEEPYIETNTFREIALGKLLVFDMELSRSGEVISRSRVRLEFNDIGGGRTELVLSDESDDAPDHVQGWRPNFELLDRHLARRD